MISFLSNITFLNPWVLAGLGALPILWFLLRITPPAPKMTTLPTMRFLMGLEVNEQTPSHTPLWILIMRMVLASLVILSLAGPIHNPAGQLPDAKAIRLVIDNGWESAQTWAEQIKAAQEIIDRAGRDKKELYILTTAPQAGKSKPLTAGPLSHANADAILNAMEPLPWSADYKSASIALQEQQKLRKTHSYWFSSGLNGVGHAALAQSLKDQGSLTFTSPSPGKLPVLLKSPDTFGLQFQVNAITPAKSATSRPISIQATTTNGQVLDQQTAEFDSSGKPLNIVFDIPEALRNEVTQFRLTGQNGVGGMFLLDEQFQKKNVGLVNSSGEENVKPFIEARFYIQRALEPYTNLKQGSVESLLEEDISVLILPDIGNMPALTLDKLEKWVRDGGMLLRFAGPVMAGNAAQTFLTPVPLRHGGRSLEGTLSWQKPAKFTEFEEDSPFYGIEIFEDILIKQQILADPSEDLDQHIWAKLDDGTPLITADSLDQGLLVLIHTSASPDWSDLPLSGTFVKILRRLVTLSGRSKTSINTTGFLHPVWVYDGLARIKSPDSSVQPISAIEFDKQQANSTHPPGLYGRGGTQRALNIGSHIKKLTTPQSLPNGTEAQIYGDDYEHDLSPHLLYAALILLLADWIIMIALSFGLPFITRFATIVIAITTMYPAIANAQTNEETLALAQKYSDGLYLAFIKSGDASLDQQVKKGLENLNAVLSRRTSVEPAGVAPLNPEYDDLTFFPMIYWPVTERPLELSNAAINNIQGYLDHGGTILFDTRDQNQSSGRMRETANAASLRKMISSLNIPPLAPIEKDHVISRSFYLLEQYPGRYTGGTLWVETHSANNRDGVSSVIIGSHDWAGIWASVRTSRSGSVRPSTKQEEMAFRVGVNLIMYALTGNYKADQVHVPHILERLGQ